MANQEHLNKLKEGAVLWDIWRQKHPNKRPDLSGVDLSRSFLQSYGFYKSEIEEANHTDTDNRADIQAMFAMRSLAEASTVIDSLRRADLSRVNFSGADLSGADLKGTYLKKADLSGADLSGVDLSGADLSGACLKGADLSRAICVETDFTRATLTNCRIYGISVWNIKLNETAQKNLIITPKGPR
jgi:uncharacterized protein YjbI with pentapeptide repeats